MPIHLKGEPGDLAPYVLLPGDPGRARHAAENFLDEPRLYTEHRGLLGYTGRYRGVPVSVQTTGMGCPSAAIVAEELAMLGARVLLRVGTCGGTAPQAEPGDLVVAQAALPLDGTTPQYAGPEPSVPLATWRVARACEDAAREAGLRHHVGLVASEDSFYAPGPGHAAWLWARGALGVEMEASAVFTIARLRGLEAGCLLTVSNRIGDPELAAPELLALGVNRMIATALEAVVLLETQSPLAPAA